MALSKAEAAKLTNDVFMRGVIETVISDSSILMMLPFEDVTGTAIVYNRENALPTVSWHAVGDAWTESTPTFTQVTTPLRILGGDADVDQFTALTYRNPNDVKAEVISAKAKALAYEFSTEFYAGSNATNANQFDGLGVLTTAGQTLTAGANGAALTLDMMDQLVDLVKPGRPDALGMSKRTRRKLSSLRRASGNLLETDVDMFGRRALFYDGIPILVDDFVPITETQGSETAASSIYAMKFGQQGIMGLENGGIQVVNVGDLEIKDASRTRVKWYVGLALFGTLGLARLKGINAA